MRTWLFWTLLASLGALLGGCNSAEPPYPVGVMSYDEGLIGTWEVPADPQSHEAAQRFVIESREVPINDGKLDAGSIGADGVMKKDSTSRPPQEVRKAYMVGMSTGDNQELRLLAVGFSVAGKQFLGVQVAPQKLNDTGLSGWVIPVHRVFQIRRDGDELKVLTARFEVAWIPGVEILDGTKAGSDTVKTLLDEKAGAHVTTDIGRVLDLYKEGASNAELWEESKGVFKRVKP